jgi:ABC-2 type transport system ATP-binding protein
MSMIQLEQAGYRYGQARVVQDLTLSVDEGSVLGLIGPNGSGKSTVLKLVATLLRPSDGRVIVDGFDTRLDAAKVRRRVGYVPEHLGVYPGLSVWQYLAFFARCAGLSAIERNATLETLLNVVDLYDERQTDAQRLSRGMTRRLALARALVHNPTVLLLDDPLGGLDGRGRLELLEVLKELRGMGITVLVSGHLLGDIIQLSSHVAVLRQGRLTRTAAVGDLVQEEVTATRRVEIEVLLGEEVARAALAKESEVADVETDGRTIAFSYHGDRAGLSTLLDRLVENGVQVTRFGPGPGRFDELAAGLADTNGKVAV